MWKHIILSSLCAGALMALPAKAADRPVTNRAALLELSETFRERLQAKRPQLYYDLLASDDPAQKRLNENPDIQLMYIHELGFPVYYTVLNLNAARTISTDDVWPGGAGGFLLDGSGTAFGQLGVWDAGGVRATHQEFGGRVIQADAPPALHYHSTHVAGTMIASGFNPAAQGMSFAANLDAYDWDDDDTEMAAAAAVGMNVSNHSYGLTCGWEWVAPNWWWFGSVSVSTTEDYRFGFYLDEAQRWDSIAVNAPYYTIVKAVGNDRNDIGPVPGGGHWVWGSSGSVWSTVTRDPDGGINGFDCIPPKGAAKNIITVGAVNDIPGGYAGLGSVVMSGFSSWGPTDDGRIKPDVVANGVTVFSCDSLADNAYTTLNGTSMAAPNLSGSINLLVRHYEATHGNVTPLSSTMKAVIIHTADEAGPNPGPDYMYGWGLANTLAAAQLINADSAGPGLIREGILANGQIDEYFIISGGMNPIRITLTWTDPPGTPPAPAVDPLNPMLVNDLDLRLERIARGTVTWPYVLDPGTPAAAAVTGDNFRDNVEQVFLVLPSAGTYRVTVTHKGTLAAPQDYSLVSSIAWGANWTFFAASSVAVPGGPRSVTLADFDRDGDLDMATTSEISSNYSLLLNDGASNFTMSATSGVAGSSPEKVVAADLNADGAADLAIAVLTGGVSVHLNDGAGSFLPPANYTTDAAGSFSVASGWLNGYTGPDLVASSQPHITVLGNPPYPHSHLGLFYGHTNYVTGGTSPMGVAVGRFNADDQDDIVVANGHSDNVSVFLSNWAGSYEPSAITYATKSAPFGVAASDFNGDGFADMAVACQGSDSIMVFLNSGTGFFSFRYAYPVGDSPFRLTAADLDGDGDRDLAVVNAGSDDVSILKNDGSGYFSVPHNIDVGDTPEDIVAGDLDGDGDLDLAVACRNSNAVWLLENLSGTDCNYNGILDQNEDSTSVTFTVSGTSNAIGWSWRLIGTGFDYGETRVPGLAAGMGPEGFVDMFIQSINANTCPGVRTRFTGRNSFTITVPGPELRFYVGPFGGPVTCAVTLGPCWFNPYISVSEVPLPSIKIGKTHNTYQGQHEFLSITLENYELEMGGFDFLIAYDASALAPAEATPGQLLDDCGWEYFTYRYGADGNCGDACPSGLLRIFAIAETNNGANHPSCYGPPDTDPHELAKMTFLVTNDRTFECMYVPIRFFWGDCGDNSVSSVDGKVLYVSDHVYDFEGTDITDPTFGFPTYFGVQPECLNPDPDKPTAVQFIDFVNGGVDIVCADSIDDRGDINLNGVVNEVADAVLYSNYFVHGISVFNVQVDGQIAASDVNADGITLSVADLVYQIRIITGDALPYPKLTPITADADLVNGVMSVDADMGAAFVVVENSVTPLLLADNMEMKYHYDEVNNLTRILVYSMEVDRLFSGDFLGGIDGNVMTLEMATYDGAPVTTKLVPDEFALYPSYPNPFNPVTTISFALASSVDYELVIYNALGQTVKTFIAHSGPGLEHIDWNATGFASGVYFYRLTAGDFTDTKKMVLLK